MNEPDDLAQHVFVRRDMKSPLEIPCGGGGAIVFSRGRPGSEGANEDAAALVSVGPGRGLLMVADGAGGHAAGAQASAAALTALVSAATAEVTPEVESEPALRSRVLDGIERAGEAVTALGSGAATTLAVLEIDAGAIRPYHVGDSEILVVGQRGRIRLQIVPHSPTGYGVEAGLLDAEEAIGHADRHFVSNVVGSPDMRIEIGPTVRLRPRDTVLLATDGLFDNLRVEEIVEIVRKGQLMRAARALVARVAARMQGASDDDPCKPDDHTFVLWRPGAAPPKREGPDS